MAVSVLITAVGSGSFLDFVIDVGFVRDISLSTRLDTCSLFVKIGINSLFIGVGIEMRELIALI